MTSTAIRPAAGDEPVAASVGVVLRDIARGGPAGAVAGIVVAGLGGRPRCGHGDRGVMVAQLAGTPGVAGGTR